MLDFEYDLRDKQIDSPTTTNQNKSHLHNSNNLNDSSMVPLGRDFNSSGGRNNDRENNEYDNDPAPSNLK